VPFPVVFVVKVLVLEKILRIEFEPVDTSLIPPRARKY
jgi:hypothetical protein